MLGGEGGRFVFFSPDQPYFGPIADPYVRNVDRPVKYLCLAYEEERKLNDLSPEEWSALRAETLAYVNALQESGRLVSAHPLRSARTASTVRVRDGRRTVTDGPFAETKEQLGGFFLIEVESAEEALSIAADWPSARIGSIEVRPVEEGLDPERRYR